MGVFTTILDSPNFRTVRALMAKRIFVGVIGDVQAFAILTAIAENSIAYTLGVSKLQ